MRHFAITGELDVHYRGGSRVTATQHLIEDTANLHISGNMYQRIFDLTPQKPWSSTYANFA